MKRRRRRPGRLSYQALMRFKERAWLKKQEAKRRAEG
jgi:hypothetical protein